MGMLQNPIRNTQWKAVLFQNALYHRKWTTGIGNLNGVGRAREPSAPTEKRAENQFMVQSLPQSYAADDEALGDPKLVNLIGLCYSNLVNEPRFPTLLLLLPVEHLRRVYTLVSDLLNNRSRRRTCC